MSKKNETMPVLFENLLTSLPGMIWVCDASGRCSYTNPAWQAFTGQTAEEAEGKGWLALMHPEDTQAVFVVLTGALKVQTGFDLRLRLKRRDGEYRWFQMTAAPLKGGAGVFDGYAATLTDITDVKEVDNVKDELVTTISHELRTPLTIVREAIAQVVDGLFGEITPDQKESLVLAVHNLDRLEHIIHDLLDISKLETSGPEIRKSLVNLVDIAKNAAGEYEREAKRRGLELVEHYATDTLEVFANEDKIGQVFKNLLSNAVRFTAQGTIEIRIEMSDEGPVASVSDTGKGIAAADLPKLFGKFQQFERIPGPGEMGTGLGLAICRGIIELHQGKIWAESDAGKGSKFSFLLPKLDPLDLFAAYVKDGAKLADKQKGALSIAQFHIKNFPVMTEQWGRDGALEMMENLRASVKSSLKRRAYAVVKDDQYIAAALPLADRAEALQVAESMRKVFSKALAHKNPDFHLDMTCQVTSYPKDEKNIDRFLSRFLD